MDAPMPPVDVPPFVQTQEIDRKRRGSGRNAAIAIGTVLILSDGSECVVTGFDANGQPLCVPVDP